MHRRPMPRAFRRPSGIVEGMRWLYLVSAIATFLLAVPAPLMTANGVTVPIAVGAGMVLILSWVVGYRSRRTSLGLELVDAAAICAFALSCPVPMVAFGLAFSGLWFRSLYGSVARTLLTAAIYATGICAALPLWRFVPNGFPQPAAMPILGTVPSLFLITAVGRVLGASLFKREESARRDAALATTGTAMLVALSRSEVLSHANRAAAAICAATPGLRSIAIFPDADGAPAVFPNGDLARQPTGVPDNLVEFSAAGAATVRDPEHLNTLAGTACAWKVIPAPDRAPGQYLLLGAPKRVPTEALDTMTSLLNQVTFALRNIGDRHELTRQARTDELTGLSNRAAFTEALDGCAGPATVLFIDLDGFKSVNDGLGHAAGDHLLRVVAGRLSAIAAPYGCVTARLGGDEFAVLITGRTDHEAHWMAESVVAAVRQPVPVAGTTAYVGASVGAAAAGPGPLDADLLLRAADHAMYAAKTAGKNQVRWFAERVGALLVSSS